MAFDRKKYSKNKLAKINKKQANSNKRSKLKRAIKIQEIVKEWGKNGKGYSQVWIYDNIIDAPGSDFSISYPTFCRYLTIPSPRKQLELLTTKK